MNKKKITLVAGTEQTRLALVKQLQEYISDVADIKSYAIDEGITRIISDELIILSSQIVKNELLELNLLNTDCEMIVAKRTIGYGSIDQIVFLPERTKVLFVNDVEQTAREGVMTLQELGIDYLNLIPYYPELGEDRVEKAAIAITPGEIDKVPAFIEQVYDIGPRIMDFATIISILYKLDILQLKAGQFSRGFLQKIVNLGKKLAQSANEVKKLNQHLSLIINGLNEALLVYDVRGKISVANEHLKKLINLNFQHPAGMSIKDVIYNKELLDFLMSNDREESKLFNLNNQQILINKFSLPGSDFLISVFKNEEERREEREKVRRDLIKKGFYAKYSFADIIGESSRNKRTKQIAGKLAKTDLTILLEGESGTGKELFASAIHNQSERKNGPFLAVNFSALPDELIESELFGYEEGAFTGARKGGKAGLFEQADGGTIFLDEVGDVSGKVQARLLRVLQEKEVMRIGGSQIKKIDVRIIAATNRDLARLVNQGKFREDLYYRLKMGYIKIPALRERKEDLLQLMEYFIGIETTEKINITDEVISELLSYSWYGNVRELKNTLNYMLAVRDNNLLTIKDIPAQDFFQQRVEPVTKGLTYKAASTWDAEYLFILQKIKELNQRGLLVGRRVLAEETKGTAYQLTEYQLRTRLVKLSQAGFINRKRGRVGTVLTDRGQQYLNRKSI